MRVPSARLHHRGANVCTSWRGKKKGPPEGDPFHCMGLFTQGAQVLLWHALLPHEIPHPPQLLRSTLVFVHLPPAPESSAPQRSNEPGHVHPVAPQICPGSHLFPQP